MTNAEEVSIQALWPPSLASAIAVSASSFTFLSSSASSAIVGAGFSFSGAACAWRDERLLNSRNPTKEKRSLFMFTILKDAK